MSSICYVYCLLMSTVDLSRVRLSRVGYDTYKTIIFHKLSHRAFRLLHFEQSYNTPPFRRFGDLSTI